MRILSPQTGMVMGMLLVFARFWVFWRLVSKWMDEAFLMQSWGRGVEAGSCRPGRELSEDVRKDLLRGRKGPLDPELKSR